jgi:hypothetical protein
VHLSGIQRSRPLVGRKWPDSMSLISLGASWSGCTPDWINIHDPRQPPRDRVSGCLNPSGRFGVQRRAASARVPPQRCRTIRSAWLPPPGSSVLQPRHQVKHCSTEFSIPRMNARLRLATPDVAGCVYREAIAALARGVLWQWALPAQFSADRMQLHAVVSQDACNRNLLGGLATAT